MVLLLIGVLVIAVILGLIARLTADSLLISDEEAIWRMASYQVGYDDALEHREFVDYKPPHKMGRHKLLALERAYKDGYDHALAKKVSVTEADLPNLTQDGHVIYEKAFLKLKKFRELLQLKHKLESTT